MEIISTIIYRRKIWVWKNRDGCYKIDDFIKMIVTLLFLIGKFLENSSNRQLENSGAFWKIHPDQMLHIIYGFSQKIRMDEFSNKRSGWRPRIEKKLNRYPGFLMDEFSSKTACVTTRKMKISDKFLDEFSMICQ